MKFNQTEFNGLMIIEPRIFKDQRGYFFESYNENIFYESSQNYIFVQDNQSRSLYGVIRGLHYQIEPYAQTKLVRVLQGKIFDVAVDLRQGSATYKEWFGIELDDENQWQLLIPKGFAHGFSVLSETATILYKCDDFYVPEAERGIIYNDKELKIDWGLKSADILVSDKDLKLPSLADADANFKYRAL